MSREGGVPGSPRPGRRSVRSPLAALLFLAAAGFQEPANERLREALDDRAPVGPWIYDDLEAACAEGSRTGKPLMVVLRCVP